MPELMLEGKPEMMLQEFVAQSRCAALDAFRAGDQVMVTIDMTPKKAEADLVELIRGRDSKGFQVSVTLSDLRWTVVVEDIEGASGRTIGEGDSFTEAWFNQSPAWA